VVGRLRDELGDQALAAAWAEGQAMSPDDASAYALGEPAPAGCQEYGRSTHAHTTTMSEQPGVS
jgi:hypothetical protein